MTLGSNLLPVLWGAVIARALLFNMESSLGASNTLSKDQMRRHQAAQETQLKTSCPRVLESSELASAEQHKIKGGRPGCHGLRGGLV